jgi:hypothetical protein
MSHAFLVVDPGKLTGYGLYFPERGEFLGGELEHFEFLDHFDGLVADTMVRGVVWESFHISQRTLQQRTDIPYSIEQIGVMRWRCKQLNKPYVSQTPGEAKGFATDAKLQALGWFKATSPGEKGHRRDAARHALLFGVNSRRIDPKRFITL